MKKSHDKTYWYMIWGAVSALLIVLFLPIFTDILSPETQRNDQIEDPVIINDPTYAERREAEQRLIEIQDRLDEYDDSSFIRNYQWDHDGHTYTMTLTLFPEAYEAFRERERSRDYDLFASDYFSKEFIGSITEILSDIAKANGLSDSEIPYFIISFVQNLEYTSDDVTTGFDEYPRFPYETIYDNGGDCEDTSILAASMLKELGYGVVLLLFSDHMAIGVKCTPTYGQSYYTYLDIEYCYLETTAGNWDIGEVPDDFKGRDAKVVYIMERPALDIEFSADYQYDARDVFVDIDMIITNLGSEAAENTKIYVALQAPEDDMVWDQTESEGAL